MSLFSCRWVLVGLSLGSIFLGLVWPKGIGPLDTFHAEWISSLGWLILGVAALSGVGALNQAWPLEKKLAIALPLSLLIATVVDYAARRFEYGGAAVLMMMHLAVVTAAVWLGWHVLRTLMQTNRQDPGERIWMESVFYGVAWIVLAAAVYNAISGLAQYFSVPLPDWLFVKLRSARVYGNLRQANLFALLLNIGLVCLLLILQRVQVGGGTKRWHGIAAFGVAALLGVAIALSWSRTGALILWVMLAMALFPGAIAGRARQILITAVVAHALCWIAMTLAVKSGVSSYAVSGTVQLIPGQGNFSSFRSEIWSGMWGIVVSNPLVGVGAGNAAYAYFLQNVPVRVDLNMQHAHNLPLQIAVEHGLPFTIAWLGILATFIWAVRAAWRHPIGRPLVMLCMAFAIHSNLEYPLWYLLFALPCAFFFGGLAAVASALRTSVPEVSQLSPAKLSPRWLVCSLICGFALHLFVLYDYQKILPAFKGTYQQAMSNVEQAYTTKLFAYAVDYVVAANVAVTPENAAAYYRLTTRLHKRIIQPFTVMNLSLASQLVGKTDEAVFYLRRLQDMSDTGVEQFWAKLTPTEREILLPALNQLEQQ